MATIAEEISALRERISSAYDVIDQKGGDVPFDRTSWNLSASIDSIPTGGPLPSAARLEYLESTGTQWIDTGTSMKYGDVFEFDFTITNLTSSGNYQGGYILASLIPNGARTYALGWYQHNTYGRHFLFCFTDDSSSYTTFPTPDSGVRYKVTCRAARGNMAMTVNGTTYVDTANNTEVNGLLTVFARATAASGGKVTTVNAMSKLKLYSLKHYRGGVLIHDYIPVRVGSVGYLYESVSGELLSNIGTGDFVLGPDVG